VPEAEPEAKAQDGAVSFLSTAATARATGAEAPLTWRALQAMGAGFWLSDQHLLRCASSLAATIAYG